MMKLVPSLALALLATAGAAHAQPASAPPAMPYDEDGYRWEDNVSGAPRLGYDLPPPERDMRGGSVLYGAPYDAPPMVYEEAPPVELHHRRPPVRYGEAPPPVLRMRPARPGASYGWQGQRVYPGPECGSCGGAVPGRSYSYSYGGCGSCGDVIVTIQPGTAVTTTTTTTTTVVEEFVTAPRRKAMRRSPVRHVKRVPRCRCR